MKSIPPIFVFLLFSIITFVSPTLLSKNFSLDKVTVYKFEEIDGTEYGYRIPSLVVTNQGTLLAFAERRVGLHDHAQNDIVLKRSANSGKTWGDLVVLADMGKASLNDPCAVVLASGRILLMYQMFPYGVHTGYIDGWIQMADTGYDGPRNTKTFLIYSDDDGNSWSDPRDITKLIRPNNRISVGSPGTGIQLTRGEHKGRVILPLYFTRKLNEDERDFTNGIAWSDDEGDTWYISNDIPEKGHTGNGNEAQVLELSDGSILFIARNQGGNFRKYSISRNGGTTWENMRIQFDLPGVACQSSVLRYSFGEGDANLLIHANPASRYRRTKGTIRLSYNDGQSWEVAREIDDVFFAYSCLGKLKDGRIGLLFEADNYRRIKFTSFTPDWVKKGDEIPPGEYYSIPTINLDKDTQRQTIVDKEKGQYLGHVTTVLLEDGKTMIAVYPKGHGKGAIVMKRSSDGGKTWSDRLPTPKSWETSKEVPTIYRVEDAVGKKRLIMFSGLYPTRMAVSEDDGITWSELEKVGDWGGIVVMGCLVPLQTGKGHYMALFHDDGRFMEKDGVLKYKRDQEIHNSPMMTLYKSISIDGGLTWSYPEEIYKSREIHLCEPGYIRSPDGEQIAVFLRENSRRSNSHIIFSNDNGRTWTPPREMPNTLNGDRHTAKYTPDGRIIVVFRDRSPDKKFKLNKAVNSYKVDMNTLAEKAGYVSPTYGDWVAWVGTYEDLVSRNEGQYRIRIKDNKKGADTTYPGVEILPDGTVSTTTYGHWEEGEEPYILNVRFKIEEIDALADALRK